MKTKTALSKENIFNFIFIFLTSGAFGYALTNHFLLDHPNTTLLLVTGFFFLAAIASWQRKKYSK
ncbi:hypothetical protein ACQ9BO_01555 [Flavobacterium sp. P21]|uniref:hypothetical protein n=1 Tax=Flavobacterium sp. P21 TaxID=3423948 RepID=UPI003D66E15B